MSEDKKREAEEQRKWQELVDAINAKEEEKARRIAARIERAQRRREKRK